MNRIVVLLALIASVASSAAAEPPADPKLPAIKLSAWRGGVILTSRKQEDMYIYYYFYEHNRYDAVTKKPAGGPLPGVQPIAIADAEGTEAVLGAEDLRLKVKAVDDGAELSLSITNKTDYDWSEIAAIEPCLFPGLGLPPNTKDRFNPLFVSKETTYLLTAKGLELLKDPNRHYNAAEVVVDKVAKWVPRDNYARPPNATIGVLIRESNDNKWVTGIVWEDFLDVRAHDLLKCMHVTVRVGPLKQGETRTLRGKVYLFEGTKDDCLQRCRRDFPKLLPAAKDE